MTFRAIYDGVCGDRDCEDRVHRGDAVRFVADVLFHDECAPYEPPGPGRCRVCGREPCNC